MIDPDDRPTATVLRWPQHRTNDDHWCRWSGVEHRIDGPCPDQCTGSRTVATTTVAEGRNMSAKHDYHRATDHQHHAVQVASTGQVHCYPTPGLLDTAIRNLQDADVAFARVECGGVVTPA